MPLISLLPGSVTQQPDGRHGNAPDAGPVPRLWAVLRFAFALTRPDGRMVVGGATQRTASQRGTSSYLGGPQPASLVPRTGGNLPFLPQLTWFNMVLYLYWIPQTWCRQLFLPSWLTLVSVITRHSAVCWFFSYYHSSLTMALSVNFIPTQPSYLLPPDGLLTAPLVVDRRRTGCIPSGTPYAQLTPSDGRGRTASEGRMIEAPVPSSPLPGSLFRHYYRVMVSGCIICLLWRNPSPAIWRAAADIGQQPTHAWAAVAEGWDRQDSQPQRRRALLAAAAGPHHLPSLLPKPHANRDGQPYLDLPNPTPLYSNIIRLRFVLLGWKTTSRFLCGPRFRIDEHFQNHINLLLLQPQPTVFVQTASVSWTPSPFLNPQPTTRRSLFQDRSSVSLLPDEQDRSALSSDLRAGWTFCADYRCWTFTYTNLPRPLTCARPTHSLPATNLGQTANLPLRLGFVCWRQRPGSAVGEPSINRRTSGDPQPMTGV